MFFFLLKKRFLQLGVAPLLIFSCLFAETSLTWAQSDFQTTPETPSSQSDINPDITGQSDLNPETIDPGNLLESVPDSPEAAEIGFSLSYESQLGPFYGNVATNPEISSELSNLSTATGTKPGLVYVVSTSRGLQLILVTATQSESDQQAFLDSRVPQNLVASTSGPVAQAEVEENPNIFVAESPEATPGKVKKIAKRFRRRVSSPIDTDSDNYLESAQQLYQWIIEPLTAELEAKKVDTLIFVLDEGLRTIPIAALHDGKQFLVEKYNLSLIPSFSLTDTRYKPIQGARMLGMGITQSVEGLSALPSVEVEIPTLTNEIWQGQPLLDQSATVAKLRQLTREKNFDIIHLATHAEFNRGNLSNSFIQLWDQKLNFSDLREISRESNWNQNPTIELLVLSACQTALGSKNAELGFTGLALQTGVKSVLGSLWYVSDDGTLALMSEFYDSLNSAPIKSAALREAQIAMLEGNITVENGTLTLSDGFEIDLKKNSSENINLAHPYYWSSFTLVGNWN